MGQSCEKRESKTTKLIQKGSVILKPLGSERETRLRPNGQQRLRPNSRLAAFGKRVALVGNTALRAAPQPDACHSRFKEQDNKICF